MHQCIVYAPLLVECHSFLLPVHDKNGYNICTLKGSALMTLAYGSLCHTMHTQLVHVLQTVKTSYSTWVRCC